METHSSILAREIPWTEEPGGLQSMGSWWVGPDLATKQQKGFQTLERETSDDLKFKPHTIHFEVKQRMSVKTPLFSNL